MAILCSISSISWILHYIAQVILQFTLPFVPFYYGIKLLGKKGLDQKTLKGFGSVMLIFSFLIFLLIIPGVFDIRYPSCRLYEIVDPFALLLALIPLILGLILILAKQMNKQTRLLLGIALIIISLASIFTIAFIIYKSGPPHARCIFEGDGIKCSGQQIIADDGNGFSVLRFKAKSIMKETTNFSFAATEGSSQIKTNCIVMPNYGIGIKPGEKMEVTCTYNRIQYLTVGDKTKFDIEANYTLSNQPVRTLGEVYAEVK